MPGYLRIRMRERDTVFVRNVAKRDAKEACREHLQMFRGEMSPTPKTMPDGRREYEGHPIPSDVWIFEWISDPGTPQETVELLTLDTF